MIDNPNIQDVDGIGSSSNYGTSSTKVLCRRSSSLLQLLLALMSPLTDTAVLVAVCVGRHMWRFMCDVRCVTCAEGVLLSEMHVSGVLAAGGKLVWSLPMMLVMMMMMLMEMVILMIDNHVHGMVMVMIMFMVSAVMIETPAAQLMTSNIRWVCADDKAVDHMLSLCTSCSSLAIRSHCITAACMAAAALELSTSSVWCDRCDRRRVHDAGEELQESR